MAVLSDATNRQGPGNKEKYQKLTQLEHVLLRPDTYIGSTGCVTEDMWVHDEDGGLTLRPTRFSPGLYKIVDEIIVNAADNKWKWGDKGEQGNIERMDTIRVTIDAPTNTISVWNNGYGIPVRMHATEGVYVPELIFGNLLTSSNYNDNEKKFTGGRNGYGAKLTNIYSTEFQIETADTVHGKKYKQAWHNSMSSKDPPTITDLKSGEDYTCVTFKPDLRRFHMETLDKDIVGLLRRRVYDLAGTLPGVKVYLNGDLLFKRAKPTQLESSFKQYVEMYLGAGWGDSAKAQKKRANLEAKKNGLKVDDEEEQEVQVVDAPEETADGDAAAAAKKKAPAPKSKIVYEKIGDWGNPKSEVWEIAYSLTEGTFEQVSFVNAVATSKGGTHVNAVTENIVHGVMDAMKKKSAKSTPAKAAQIKSYVGVFVNCRLYNPAFDSQTKENMTLPAGSWTRKPALSDATMKRILQSGVLDRVERFIAFKTDEAMTRKDASNRRSRPMIPSLEDANKAGSSEGHKCTLIICEGESAKAWAISGLKYVNRDYYGIFPIRGKLINVRDASTRQVMENKEITNIKQILGLRHNVEYQDLKTLRYGSLMIMTDQDHDGSHIKGLLINFFDHFFPSLLKIEGFLVEFITPIVKAQRGQQKVSFFTMPEYEAWKESTNNGHGWRIKYYKGLGTNQKEDAKEYFTDLPRHRIPFAAMQSEEHELVDMAFNKKRAEDRRTWLGDFVPGTYLDQNVPILPIKDFINKELVLFSMADNARSIPSIMDGLKPGQRKVIFGCFKRRLKDEIKVAQLQGYVSEHAAYHHGEMSLQATIIGLAQRFVGTNNLNLLEPRGTFGSRQKGGKDSAAARYIFTTLSPITRMAFNELDDPLLTYLNDDGLSVEPQWYAPVVPMLLINGSDGIGTGWSSTIPQYHPKDVVANLRRRMRNEPYETIHPWYRGFYGSIGINTSGTSNSAYVTRGACHTTRSPHTGLVDAVVVTELPIGTWTDHFKEWVSTNFGEKEKTTSKADEPASRSAVKKEHLIADIKNYSDDDNVLFRFELTDQGQAKFEDMEPEDIAKFFKLESFLSVSNLVCFDPEGRIHKYASVNDIIEEFYHVRFDLFRRRKDYHLRKLQEIVDFHYNKARFAEMLHRKEIELRAIPVNRAAELLQSLDFARFTKSGSFIGHARDPASTTSSNDDGESLPGLVADYLYLLDMPQRTATPEYVARLRKQADELQTELLTLAKKSAYDLWEEDLTRFESEWDRIIDAEERERQDIMQRTSSQADKDAAKKPVKRRAKAPAKPKADSAKSSTRASPTKAAKAKASPHADFKPLVESLSKVGAKKEEAKPGTLDLFAEVSKPGPKPESKPGPKPESKKRPAPAAASQAKRRKSHSDSEDDDDGDYIDIDDSDFEP